MSLLIQFQNYLFSQKKTSGITVKNYVSDIRHFINWFEKSLSQPFSPNVITPQTIEAFKKSNSEDLSPASLKRHASSLHKFFLFLKDNNMITVNPFDSLFSQNQRQSESDPFYLNKFKNYLYLDNASRLTIKNYLNDVRQFLLWSEDVTRIRNVWDVKDRNIFDRIDSSLIDEYKQRLVERKSSPLTINRKLASLKKYTAWAEKEGLIRRPISFASILLDKSKSTDQTKELLRNYPIIHGQNISSGEELVKKPSRIDRFPPIKLFKKTSKEINCLLDLILIAPVVLTIEGVQEIIWKLRRRPIFQDISKKDQGNTLTPIDRIQISSFKKDFYAPLSISTKHMSLHRKIIYHLRHTRPKWYRKYHSYAIAHYINFTLLIVFASILGFRIYQSLFQGQETQKLVLGASQYGGSRFLSFKQKLTDSSGNPITGISSLRFSIYNDPVSSGSSLLWQETDTVMPDKDGQFLAELGKNTPIPQSLFLENPSLWLGITVGDTEELAPRQQLANVLYADNAYSLQGLTPITQLGDNIQESNAILALDSSGNLSIGGDAPHTFQVVNSQFILSGNILTFSTTPGTNSNIQLSPDGFGKIDVQKPLQNSTNNNNIPTAVGAVEVDDLLAVLATSSGQSAFTINQNGIGPIISASSSGVAKFTVDNFGDTTIAGDVILSGILPGISTSTDSTLTLQNSSSGDIQFFSSQNTLSSNGSLTISGNLNLASPSATTTFGGINYVWPTSGQTNGSFLETNGNGTLSWNPLPNATDWVNQTGGHLGIGTTNFGGATGPVLALANNGATAPSGVANQGILYVSAGALKYQGPTTLTTIAAADYAEDMPFLGSLEPGDIVSISSTPNPQGSDIYNKFYVEKPTIAYDQKIIGVVSSFIDPKSQPKTTRPVSLVGRVPVNVSTENGPINAGDPITSSSVPGVGMKATKPGVILGKALESLNSSNCQPQAPQSDNFGLIEQNPACQGKILVFVNVGYNDPNPPMLSSVENFGNFALQKINDSTYQLTDDLGNTAPRVEVLAGAFIANLKTASLSVTTDSVSINGQSLKDYIASVVENLGITEPKIISPIVSADEIHTNIISPIADNNIIVKLATPSASSTPSFIIQNSSGSAVATIDNNGNASIEGQLSAQSIHSQTADISSASISGILRANKIVADQITTSGNQNSADNKFINVSTLSAQFAYVDNINSETGNFNQGLIALGPSSFSDVSVAGQLSIGTSFTLSNNSINVLGGDLELQPLKQGGLSIMSGLLYIDTDGNLKVSGNAEFAKDVVVKGELSANIIAPIPNQDIIVQLGTASNPSSSFTVRNSSSSAVLSINNLGDLIASGEGTFNKINLSFAEPALAVSPTEVVATGSAGIATISAYQKEITIDNGLITDHSLIYVTPKTDTENLVLYLIRQLPGISFTIGINTPLSKDVPFNWIIIN